MESGLSNVLEFTLGDNKLVANAEMCLLLRVSYVANVRTANVLPETRLRSGRWRNKALRMGGRGYVGPQYNRS